MKNKEILKRLRILRNDFFIEMEKSVKDSGSQLSYIVDNDLVGLGEKRDNGAIGVHGKSHAGGRCSAYCYAINSLQMVICELEDRL